MADSFEEETPSINSFFCTLDRKPGVNIGLIGPVSVGKTTLVNALFTSTYGNTALKRSTLCPQLYYETLNEDDLYDEPEKIYELNNKNYQELSSKSELTESDIEELEYFVPMIQNFVKLPKKLYYTVHDIPGLNDGHDRDIYFKYVQNHFDYYDIVVYIIDVNSKFESSDDFSILNMIISQFQMSKEKFLTKKLIIVVNKCDDMEDKRTHECYKKIKTILNKKLEHTEIDYDILHMSCETAYMYRMIQNRPDVVLDDKYYIKIGLNQYGKVEWKKMDHGQRIDRVKLDLKNGNIEVLESGFEKFIECVHSFLYEKDGQKSATKIFSIFENKIRYEWENQFNQFKKFLTQKDPDIELNTYIPEFLLKYAKKVKANSLYLEYMEKYFTMIHDDCTDISFENLTTIKLHLVEILREVKIYIPSIPDEPYKSIIKSIQNGINKHYDELLRNTDDMDEAKEYLDILQSNSYSGIYDCIAVLFKNMILKCELTNNECFDFLDNCLTLYQLDQNQIMNILLQVLPVIYQKIYRHISENSDSRMSGILSLVYEYLPEIHGKSERHIKYHNIRIYVRMLITRMQQMTGPDSDFDDYQKWINLARDNYSLKLEHKLVHLLTNTNAK